MNNIRDTYYMLMVQYEPGEGDWWLYKVFEHLADAEALKKHCIKMDIKNGFKKVYKIFTYKLCENA